mmetsp:Transcript_28052/g.69186  ORF Transcript_28052/g.69186 Transcript_28052/m.69186 type:complete len:540 (+) Transcript_28052:681-2300(+)
MAERSAAQWKAEGNARFAAKQFAEAAEAYTRALALEPDAVFYSNRCACLLKLGDLDSALVDALKLREMRPEWAKSHFREGSVLAAMGRPVDAARALCQSMQLGPSEEVELALRAEMDAAGLYDAPDQQTLLTRCLSVLASSGKAGSGSGGGGALAGAWKRCVLPSEDGPSARAGATIAVVGSSLWLIGGLNAGAPVKAQPEVSAAGQGEVHRLETSVEPSSWAVEQTSAAAGQPPVARGGHATCVRARAVWLFGGHTAEGEVLSDLHALDTLSLRWRLIEAADPPKARHAHSLVHEAGRDRLLLFGGVDAANAPLGDLLALLLAGAEESDSLPDSLPDLAAQSGAAPGLSDAPPGLSVAPPRLCWVAVQTSGSPPAPREMHACALVPACCAEEGGLGAGLLLVYGGRSGGKVLNDLWLLDLETHTWQCAISPFARCSHALSLRPPATRRGAGQSAELVVFGGFDGSALHDSTLLLTLTRDAERPALCAAKWRDLYGDLKGAPKARFAHAQAATSRAVYVFGGAFEGGSLADTNRLDLTL